MKFISNLDIFGVPMLSRIDDKDLLHKSFIGGIVTIFIVICSLAYSLWIFYLWGTNSMNPTIITEQYLSNFEHLDVNYDVIKANYLYYLEEGNIDPIKTNILIPIVQYSMTDSTGVQQYFEQIVLRPSNETDSLGSPYLIPKMNITYNNQYTQNWSPSNQIYLLFIQCQQELLPEGEICATQEFTEQFYNSQYTVMTIEVHTRLLNPQDKQIQENAQLYYLQLEPTLCVTLNVNLKSTYYEISDYFLFGGFQIEEFITGIEAYSQTNTVNMCNKMYPDFTNVYGALILQMFNTQQKTVLQYPGAGQLFANIGSIISILFTLRFVIFRFNQRQLRNKIINQLINIYYPQHSKIKIIKNWKNQIIAIYKDSQPIDINQYIKFHKRIKKMLVWKLSWINLNYEMSRIYFILRQFFTREEIRKFHYIGIQLGLQPINPVESCRSSTDFVIESEMQLTEEDAYMFTLKQKGYENQQSIKQSFGSNYFDLNQIV